MLAWVLFGYCLGRLVDDVRTRIVRAGEICVPEFTLNPELWS
jgi:hypothetical protein